MESIQLTPLLETFLESWGSSAVLVVDVVGKIVFVSKRAAHLLETTAESLLRQSFFTAVSFKDAAGKVLPRHKRPLYLAQHTPGFADTVPYFCFLDLPGKEPFQVAINITPVSEADGKVISYVIGLRKVKRELNVDEMKTLFASFAAHQLKTPSGIVKGFLELLLREGEGGFSYNQWSHLLSAYEANEHLIRRSRTLLNLTKLEGGMLQVQKTTFKPKKLIAERIKTYANLLSYRKITVKDFTRSGLSCTTDSGILLEVFDIMFGNAIKHSPLGGSIKIECTELRGYISLSVRDNGKGMTQDVMKNLFQRASPANIMQNSHGLGLYMAQKYMVLLKGELRVESESGKGALFTAKFPV